MTLWAGTPRWVQPWTPALCGNAQLQSATVEEHGKHCITGLQNKAMCQYVEVRAVMEAHSETNGQ
jgi:hypothetical protein